MSQHVRWPDRPQGRALGSIKDDVINEPAKAQVDPLRSKQPSFLCDIDTNIGFYASVNFRVKGNDRTVLVKPLQANAYARMNLQDIWEDAVFSSRYLLSLGLKLTPKVEVGVHCHPLRVQTNRVCHIESFVGDAVCVTEAGSVQADVFIFVVEGKLKRALHRSFDAQSPSRLARKVSFAASEIIEPEHGLPAPAWRSRSDRRTNTERVQPTSHQRPNHRSHIDASARVVERTCHRDSERLRELECAVAELRTSGNLYRSHQRHLPGRVCSVANTRMRSAHAHLYGGFMNSLQDRLPSEICYDHIEPIHPVPVPDIITMRRTDSAMRRLPGLVASYRDRGFPADAPYFPEIPRYSHGSQSQSPQFW